LRTVLQEILLPVSTDYPTAQRAQSLDDLDVFGPASEIAGGDDAIDLVPLRVV
jgi:hypothetical protein